MANDERRDEDPPPGLGPVAYFRLLNDARGVSERTLERLHTLRDHFPSALSAELIEQVERIRTDSAHERRRVPRLPETSPTAVAEPDDLAEWARAPVLNRSPGGLALLLNHAVEPGTVLLVWNGFAGEDAWLPFEVRHCRPEGNGWVVGGQFIYLTLSGSREDE
jgi:hypothetical protein